ncbi:MAG TPA: pilus assembly protein TadG-related protein, partial [Chloroflexota bacterium]|nr:pilus assembly protein TadG-related protein [Chloroflexota bacterium]
MTGGEAQMGPPWYLLMPIIAEVRGGTRLISRVPSTRGQGGHRDRRTVPDWLRRWLGAVVKPDDGSVLVFVAVMMLVLIGFVGLAIDTGISMLTYRQAQNAADAAALGAASTFGQGLGQSAAVSTAQFVAQQNGFSSSDLTLTFLDGQGNPTADSTQIMQVRIVIQHTFATTFMQILGVKTSTVTTSAVAGVWQALLCGVCLLSPNGSPALSLTGNGSISVTGNGIIVNSSASNAAELTGNGNLTATTIGIVGGWSAIGNGRFTPSPVRARAVPDPLAAVPVPSTSGPVLPSIALSGNQNGTASPGIYQTLSVTGNGNLTLQPGVYIIFGSTGSVSLTGNGKIQGDNVMLYFTCGTTQPAACQSGQKGASLSLTGNGSFEVTAPTSGTYQGL